MLKKPIVWVLAVLILLVVWLLLRGSGGLEPVDLPDGTSGLTAQERQQIIDSLKAVGSAPELTTAQREAIGNSLKKAGGAPELTAAEREQIIESLNKS